MSKQKRNIISASVILVLLIAVYVMLSVTASRQTSSGNPVLYQLSLDDIESFEYLADGTQVKLQREDDKFVWADDPSLPVNQDFVATMLDKAAAFTAKRAIENGTSDLAAYGLDAPKNTVTVQTKAGTKTFEIGDVIPASGDSYVLYEGSVYTVDSTFVNIFSNSILAMALRETLPDMTIDSITAVDVADEEHSLSLTKDGSAYTVAGDGTEIPNGDTTAVQNLLACFPVLRYNAMIAYNPDAAALRELGLDKESTYFEVQTEATSYRMFIGKTDETEVYTYVRPADSKAVYTIETGYLEPIFASRAADFLTMSIPSVLPAELDSLTVQTATETKTYTVKHDGSGNSYEVDGASITEAEFNKYYFQLYALVAEKRMEGLSAEGRDMILELTYQSVDGATLRIAFYEYDQNYCLADVNGMTELLINRQTINKLVQAEQ